MIEQDFQQKSNSENIKLVDSIPQNFKSIWNYNIDNIKQQQQQ